ncbi:50S ribosome-binding protein YggL [Niveibacterium terrae]|uniref:50S ribosome-binding protein YggL n=1 Tax=Niveibacterium terrae TaxID=3373598 RepID=UPI003A917E17
MSTRINPTKTQIRRLNLRQRKKLRLGEFQELGLEIRLKFAQPQQDEALWAFADAFIDLVESRKLVLSGFGGATPLVETEIFVTRDGRGSVSEEDVAVLLDWLKAKAEVASAETDGRIDAWYGF